MYESSTFELLVAVYLYSHIFITLIYSLCKASPEGSEFAMEHTSGMCMPNELLEDLLSLTRDNMKEMYDRSGDSQFEWDDRKKRGELRNDKMQWIVLRSTRLVSFLRI
jgi:hypothetical protein